jgi:hypothetical protein
MITFGMRMVSGGPLCASWFCRAIKKHNLFNISCSGVNKQSPHRRRINNAITARTPSPCWISAHLHTDESGRDLRPRQFHARNETAAGLGQYLFICSPHYRSSLGAEESPFKCVWWRRQAHMNMLNYFTADGELWPPLAQNLILTSHDQPSSYGNPALLRCTGTSLLS